MRIEAPVIAPERIVPEPEGVCPECHGRGWKVVADGGAGTAEPCDCRKAALVDEYLVRAGIPESHRRCSLSNFETSDRDPAARRSLHEALEISKSYVDSFYDPKENRFRGTGLIYLGPPGTGKTHLAVAVLTELIRRRGVRGRFVVFTSLVQKILASFDETSEESQHRILDPVIQAELLVLDEVGARKPSEWVRDILYHIVNTRYLERRPTLFTTNYPIESPRLPLAQPPRIRQEFAGSDAAVARSERQRIDQSIEDFKRQAPSERFGLLRDRISSQLVSRIVEMAQPVLLFGVKDHRTVVRKYSTSHRLGRRP